MKDSIMKIYIIDKNKFTNNYLKYCLYYLTNTYLKFKYDTFHLKPKNSKLIIFYKLPIVQ